MRTERSLYASSSKSIYIYGAVPPWDSEENPIESWVGWNPLSSRLADFLADDSIIKPYLPVIILEWSGQSSSAVSSPPPPQAKTLLNQQKSLAEWSAGPRSSVDPRPYICLDKLTFIDESLEYDCLCLQAFPEQEITSIHDFELHYSRRPKVLVQTAGHVAGATRYYQRKDVTCDPWRPSQVRGL